MTVPTPVDAYNRPDVTLLLQRQKKKRDHLSTRAMWLIIHGHGLPRGHRRRLCAGHRAGIGPEIQPRFFCGYSPDGSIRATRPTPLITRRKVTSGSTPAAAEVVDDLYGTIIAAGTHRAPSIKVAEAAKVIENAQRDINIAFVNELALIFRAPRYRHPDVLEAARTKWNFLPFSPRSCGGPLHRVDPYYLTHKAESMGYNPQVILAGRRINDGMGPLHGPHSQSR